MSNQLPLLVGCWLQTHCLPHYLQGGDSYYKLGCSRTQTHSTAQHPASTLPVPPSGPYLSASSVLSGPTRPQLLAPTAVLGALTSGISGSWPVAKKKSLYVAALPSHLLLRVLIRKARPPCLHQKHTVGRQPQTHTDAAASRLQSGPWQGRTSLVWQHQLTA